MPGKPGAEGPKGEKGEPGEPFRPLGFQYGTPGINGSKGNHFFAKLSNTKITITGEKGDQGERGERGFPGLQGLPGVTKIEYQTREPEVVVGPPGEKGERGERGERGLIGQKGQRGDVGPPGPPGPEIYIPAYGSDAATTTVFRDYGPGYRGHTGMPGERGIVLNLNLSTLASIKKVCIECKTQKNLSQF